MESDDKLDVLWQGRGKCMKCGKKHRSKAAMKKCKEAFCAQGNRWARKWMSYDGGQLER